MLTQRIALNIVFAALLAAVALALPHEATAADWCSNGVCQEWVAQYTSGNGNCYVADLATDGSGNVYVTGRCGFPAAPEDYATVKYDSDGNEMWTARYDGPASGSDFAYALAVDGSGHVYVTGRSDGDGTGGDYATIKYDGDGNELWVARYNGPVSDNDSAQALAVDAGGNVYVTGGSHGEGTGRDYATIKYDGDGNELWVARYDGPASDADSPIAMGIDASGNVYVTGDSTGDGADRDYATIKYDSDGNELWVARYDGPAEDSDSPTALAIDTSGNVYVTGLSRPYGTYVDYTTIKYDSNGNELWVAVHTEIRGGVAVALAVGGSGDVYVTGSGNKAMDTDYTTVKYDSYGNERWVAYYDGPADYDIDNAVALAIDESDGIYVTGYSPGDGTAVDQDYATVKYDSNGNELWVARYDGPASGYDSGHSLVVDGSYSVYVTGYSEGPDGIAYYGTLKYSQTPPTPTPAPTRTPGPTPSGVGGAVRMPPDSIAAESDARVEESGGAPGGARIALAAAAVASAFVLLASGYYARTRRERQR